MTRRIRVLVVDDSAFARKVLREVLSDCDDIEVVGMARDGLEALEKITQLNPDVLTLDLVMPNLDGLGVLQALPAEHAPRVVVVSISDGDTELGAAALQAGAVDIIKKPTALATDQLYELREELIAKIRIAAGARVRPIVTGEPALVPAPGTHRHRVIVIGTSTGGPQAITRLLPMLPGDLPVPVLVALHIPEGYTEALAARLDASSALDVCEARHDMPLRAGLCVIARGGTHLRLVGGGKAAGEAPRLALDTLPGGSMHMPSVDFLFESAVAQFGGATLGVVLTGMGDDGLRGATAIVGAGGVVLTESERSCVVYGMPRCIKEAGLAAAEAPIDGMAAAILRYL
jgi:two-component system chemotaxis response regulator CheB